MKEPFLINPVRRRRRSRSKRLQGATGTKTARKRSTGLPSGLLSRMIKKYGAAKGMKEAWKAHKSGRSTNPWPGARKAHTVASGVGWSKRRRRTKGRARPTGARYPRWNPLGEEVIVVANPRRRRRKRAAVSRLRRRRRNVAYALNPPRRRRMRRRVRRSYPLAANSRRRRSYKRRRRNPVSVPALSLGRPMTLIMPIATGIVAKMAVDKVPGILGLTGLPAAAAKLAVAFGGGMLLGRFIGTSNATIWTLIGAITVATDLLNEYVLKTSLGYLSIPNTLSLGAYPSEVRGSYPPLGADFGAFPYGEVVQY